MSLISESSSFGSASDAVAPWLKSTWRNIYFLLLKNFSLINRLLHIFKNFFKRVNFVIKWKSKFHTCEQYVTLSTKSDLPWAGAEIGGCASLVTIEATEAWETTEAVEATEAAEDAVVESSGFGEVIQSKKKEKFQ